MTQPFSIGEALRFGWQKTRAHSGVLFQAMVAFFALQVATSIVQRVLEGTLEGFFALLGLSVLGVFVGTGFTLITLKIAKGETATLRDLLPPGKLVWKYFCASAVSGILILVGLILFIIPGLYLMLRFAMVRFAILDGAEIMGSLDASAQATKGVKGRLLLFFLALLGINILGAVALLVGLLVTVPVSAIAYAHVYLKLKNRA